MQPPIKWGILGPGKIAHAFAQDLLLTENAILTGVASRSLERAKSFASHYQAENAFGSYEAMMDHENIDVVYIATPHVYHYENTLMCLEAGKSVLCEKPAGMNKHQLTRMIDTAKANRVFFMEALWTRFIPSTQKLLSLISEGVIGDQILLKADFGFNGNHDPEKRWFNKSLGGGALLDIGLYPVYLSYLLAGLPDHIQATARFSQTGVDSTIAMLFHYEMGLKSVLDASFEAKTPTEAFIYGENGSLHLAHPFHHSKTLTHHDYQKGTSVYDIPYVGNGYYHEILEVHDCLKHNRLESSKMSWTDSLNLITILDQVRAKINLTYETDR